MNKLRFAIIALVLISCGTSYKNPHVKIYTNLGDIEVELFPDKAPKTVAAFLSYVDSGYYKDGAFYRVIMEEGPTNATNTGLIQGGIWQTNDKQHPAIPGIEHESTRQTGLSHTSGTISLARTTLGSASTEFFICIGNQTQFDEGHDTPEDGKGFAAFGKVVEGMSVVREIQRQRSSNEHFDKNITIYKMARL
jgi:peptidyl-prolyl cis-trans isomerase A (cyclophilin A)